jgi:uncharacterized phiE125 gp8 family phage protein
MNKVGLVLTTAPSVEPLSLAEGKLFLRVDASDDDALISALIKTARRFVENYTGKALITQAWTLWLDRFPGGAYGRTPWWSGTKEGPVSMLYPYEDRRIPLLRSPVQAAVPPVITTYDLDDTATVFSASKYIVDDSIEVPEIVLRDGEVWPAPLRAAKAVKIDFTAGYGDTSATVPDDLITAMRQLLAHWYENREAVSDSAMTEVPMTVKLLLDPYKVLKL